MISLNEAHQRGSVVLPGGDLAQERVLEQSGVQVRFKDEFDPCVTVNLREQRAALQADLAGAQMGLSGATVSLYPKGTLELDFKTGLVRETTPQGVRSLYVQDLVRNDLSVQEQQGDLKKTTEFYWALSDGSINLIYHDREVSYYEQISEPTGRSGVALALEKLRQEVDKQRPGAG